MNLSDSILIVGEGNFSHSVAFYKSEIANPSSPHHNCLMYTSSYEDKSTCVEKYGELTKENVAFLESKQQIVLHSVDATKLKESLAEVKVFKFKQILFNFPHTGRKAAIQKNR